MHYPVMTERQLAFRWKISLTTLRRWRLDGEGPVWHELFQHVRYHEADVLEFERQSAQHWTAILGDGERVPRAVTHPPKAEGDPQPSDAAEPELQYISAKDIVEATSLPPAETFKMSDDPVYDQIKSSVLSAHNGHFGILSTGEQVTAALILNRADLLHEAGYTMAQAIDRVGDHWLSYIPEIERELKAEGLI